VVHYLHFVFRAELTNLGKEFLALLLLNLELSILDVELEDAVDVLGGEFRKQLALSVPGDVGDVAPLAAEQSKSLLNLLLDFCDLAGKALIGNVFELVNEYIEDPLGLLLKLFIRRSEPAFEFDLETLRNVLFNDLEVMGGTKKIIDFFGQEFVLEGLVRVGNHLFVVSGGPVISLVGEDLLLDQVLVALSLNDIAINLVSLDDVDSLLDLLWCVLTELFNVSDLFEFATATLVLLDKLIVFVVELAPITVISSSSLL
jgi:hypothetical protein